MLVGCDPPALEAVAPRCAALADLLRRARRRLDAADRHAWRGPAAARGWVGAAELSRQLGGAAMSMDLVARRLRAQADAQRRASLAPPVSSVLRVDGHGDGRWIGRVGTAGAPVLVVLVPGVGTTAADHARLERSARQVWTSLALDAQRHGTDADRVAVVAWLGYDPPDDVVRGLARGPADRGALVLRSDVAHWRREGATRVVVVGHSYGAVVAARAAEAGMAPDELVLLGAPGLGVDDASALGMPPGADLWAAAARGDAVALAARTGLVHGPDPTSVARPLPTSLPGHGAYLDDPLLLSALADLALHDPRPAGTVAATARPAPTAAPTPRGLPWASP